MIRKRMYYMILGAIILVIALINRNETSSSGSDQGAGALGADGYQQESENNTFITLIQGEVNDEEGEEYFPSANQSVSVLGSSCVTNLGNFGGLSAQCNTMEPHSVRFSNQSISGSFMATSGDVSAPSLPLSNFNVSKNHKSSRENDLGKNPVAGIGIFSPESEQVLGGPPPPPPTPQVPLDHGTWLLIAICSMWGVFKSKSLNINSFSAT